jgi:hypothetical protein
MASGMKQLNEMTNVSMKNATSGPRLRCSIQASCVGMDEILLHNAFVCSTPSVVCCSGQIGGLPGCGDSETSEGVLPDPGPHSSIKAWQPILMVEG